MTIVLPLHEHRLAPVLDTATRLLVVRWQRGREVARDQVALPVGAPTELADLLTGLRPDVLLCGVLSRELEQALAHGKWRIILHLCGDAEELLHAFLTGRLAAARFCLPGCRPADMLRRRSRPAQPAFSKP